MSKLLAINCGNTCMLSVRMNIDMDVVRSNMAAVKPLEVIAYLPEAGEDRIFTIDGLHFAKDGWGVEHIEGTIIESTGTCRAILYDNPFEADPLNLK